MPTLGPRFGLDTAQRRKWGLSAEDKCKNEGSRRSDIDSEGEGSSRYKSEAGIEALAVKTRRCQWTKVQTRIWARRGSGSGWETALVHEEVSGGVMTVQVMSKGTKKSMHVRDWGSDSRMVATSKRWLG